MKNSASCNIYEVNAAKVLAEYADFVEGAPDSTVVCISSAPVGVEAKRAIEASMEQLDLAAPSQCAWVVVGKALSPDGLWMIVEGLDPLAVIALDEAAANAISEAYRTPVAMNDCTRVFGRNIAAFQDFNAMLADEDEKQKAWSILKKTK